MHFENVVYTATVALGDFNKIKYMTMDFARNLNMPFIKSVTLTIIRIIILAKTIFGI